MLIEIACSRITTLEIVQWSCSHPPVSSRFTTCSRLVSLCQSQLWCCKSWYSIQVICGVSFFSTELIWCRIRGKSLLCVISFSSCLIVIAKNRTPFPVLQAGKLATISWTKLTPSRLWRSRNILLIPAVSCDCKSWSCNVCIDVIDPLCTAVDNLVAKKKKKSKWQVHLQWFDR